MTNRNTPVNNLHGWAQFALFTTSYLPLFVLVAARQISKNFAYFRWGGFNLTAISTFGERFGLSTFLGIISIFGYVGYRLTLRNIESVASNGFNAKVTDVKNKNSEAIGYIATYIIPFLFEAFDSWYDCLATLFLLAVIYRIFINSSLLLINPVLSFRFSIYELEFEVGDKKKSGLVISRDKYLQEDTLVKFYEIGHKLYFAKIKT